MNKCQDQMYEILSECYGCELLDLMLTIQPTDHILNEDMWSEMQLMGLIDDEEEYSRSY